LKTIPKDVVIESWDKFVKDPNKHRKVFQGKKPTLILDEAHRARTFGSKRYKNIMDKSKEYNKRLLLTASPIYHEPSNLGALTNLAAGKNIFPEDAKDFRAQYENKETRNPNLLSRILGSKPKEELKLKNKKQLQDKLKQYLDIHYNSTDNENFPKSTTKIKQVPMSKSQNRVYNFAFGKAPWWLRHKIRKGTGLSPEEAKKMNAFLSASRQISNNPSGFLGKGVKASAPKIDKITKDFKRKLKKSPEHKGIIYSNYIRSGLLPVAAKLERSNIPYAFFTGKESPQKKKQIMEDYNQGKLKALLVSSSGTEGLDTKGTRSIQVMEPHFNMEKIKQIVGRGVRYKSHEHLPKDQRKVDVVHYHATPPKKDTWLQRLKARFKPSAPSVDEYLYQRAVEKDKLNQQLLQLVQQAQPSSPYAYPKNLGGL